MDKERIVYLKEASKMTADEGMTELLNECLSEIEQLQAENKRLKKQNNTWAKLRYFL